MLFNVSYLTTFKNQVSFRPARFYIDMIYPAGLDEPCKIRVSGNQVPDGSFTVKVVHCCCHLVERAR